jgi:hypothetical protein
MNHLAKSGAQCPHMLMLKQELLLAGHLGLPGRGTAHGTRQGPASVLAGMVPTLATPSFAGVASVGGSCSTHAVGLVRVTCDVLTAAVPHPCTQVARQC